MRQDPLLKTDKCSISLEYVAGGKIHVNSSSWEDLKAILPDQVLEIRVRSDQLHLIRRPRLDGDEDRELRAAWVMRASDETRYIIGGPGMKRVTSPTPTPSGPACGCTGRAVRFPIICATRADRLPCTCGLPVLRRHSAQARRGHETRGKPCHSEIAART